VKSESQLYVSTLLISLGCILVCVVSWRHRRQMSWRPFWNLGLSRREWATQVLGGVIAMVGIVLWFTR
jgi:hypothetical protein